MERVRPQISIVVLCYKAGNEVRSIASKMVGLLAARNISFEVVLVGNYNEHEAGIDKTPEVVREVAQNDSRIIAVAEVKKGMYGFDVRSGLARASGETVAFIDGDSQMPFEDVVRVYDALIENNADYAQTYRVTRHDGAKRIFISRVYNTLLRVLFPRVTIYDGNSKPKIFTHESFEKLQLTSNNWFIDAEIAIQVCYKRLKIVQIPTVFLKLQNRASFVNAKAVMRFLVDLIRYRFTMPRD